MIYELPLKWPTYNKSKIDLVKNIQFRDKLISFTNFEEKLSYYNNVVRSLSCFSMAGHIKYQWGNPDQEIKIYCGCKSCRNEADFSTDQEIIFFQLRQKEVDRLREEVNAASTYIEKLKVIFSTPGYNPDFSPVVHCNIAYDIGKEASREMHETDPVIDLSPETEEDRIIYNEFVIADFEQKYKTPNGFSDRYLCFDYEKEKLRLLSTLKKSADQSSLLSYCKKTIEKHFNYPECLNDEEKENHISKQINEQLKRQGWLGDYLFPKMILGIDINLNSTTLYQQELLRYTHISEIAKFYKYLLYFNEQKPIYRKHPQGLELLRMPLDILKVYEVTGEYDYKDVSGYGDIPFPRFALLGSKHCKIELTSECLQAYAKGFIDGYNDPLSPFIDNSKSKIEIIFVEILRKGGKGFTEHYGHGKPHYEPSDMYESGRFEGKRYNAWGIVFDTPKLFIKLFSNPKKEAIFPKPVIALFCWVYHDSGILKRGETETIADYCEKICKKYNLQYVDRIRQIFQTSDSKANQAKIKELILPLLDKKTGNKILDYLENKQQTKQKMYG